MYPGGGRGRSGPAARAAGVAGGVYKNLSQQNYFAVNGTAGAAEEKPKDPFPILTASPMRQITGGSSGN